MNNNDIIKRYNALARTAGLFLFLSCTLLQGQAVADPAQPAEKLGYLMVFSSTQESQWGEGSYYYLHTGYRIFGADGKEVQWVENHDSSIDEAPQKIELPPGAYTIVAQSDKAGYVKVPVMIRVARTTTVRLENDRDSNVTVKSTVPGSFSSAKNSFCSWNK